MTVRPHHCERALTLFFLGVSCSGEYWRRLGAKPFLDDRRTVASRFSGVISYKVSLVNILVRDIKALIQLSHRRFSELTTHLHLKLCFLMLML